MERERAFSSGLSETYTDKNKLKKLQRESIL